MEKRKKTGFDTGEYEKLMKQLEQFRSAPEKSGDSGYFNPWNLSKRKTSGKHTICSSLPEELEKR